ncbi:hypothetical protein R1flu_027830 [Riccia fluitans]|uniref:Uncharacterized protein n=1 Tax=Riccia fluitans TaxID=41844 RepID=A0ABD1XJY3_9MARC
MARNLGCGISSVFQIIPPPPQSIAVELLLCEASVAKFSQLYILYMYICRSRGILPGFQGGRFPVKVITGT